MTTSRRPRVRAPSPERLRSCMRQRRVLLSGLLAAARPGATDMLSRFFFLHPTGADNTYRRMDYLRGSAICVAVALGLGAIAAVASNRESGPLPYVFFSATLLLALSVATALIFVSHAISGRAAPIAFAVAPGFVPVKFRGPIREILLHFWNPRHSPSRDTRAYEPYISLCYGLASGSVEPELIASALEEVEKSDSLEPGSDLTARLITARELLRLLHKE